MSAHVLVAYLMTQATFGYWAPKHQDLNEQVFCRGAPWGLGGFVRGANKITSVSDYVRLVLFTNAPGNCPDAENDEGGALRGVTFVGPAAYFGKEDRPTDAPSGSSLSLLDWNRKGGLWEDGFLNFDEAAKWGGLRAVNHFHDPLTTGGGYTGLSSDQTLKGTEFRDLLRKGMSAAEWAMNGSYKAERNYWGYPTIGESMHRAFTETSLARRESALSCAFRALGQVEHLIEDATVPDHSRDLLHPGDGWEEYSGKRLKGFFAKFSGPWVSMPAKTIEKEGFRALWDRDVYLEDPASTFSVVDPPGLSEFVNANFLAWNRLVKRGLVVDFTTIPDDVGVPFKRSWSITLLDGEISVGALNIRTNSVLYPYPLLASSTARGYFSSDGHSLPWVLAQTVDSKKVMNDLIWQQFGDPLLGRALGYAQTVVSLALQPARAEVVPSDSGDPLKVSIRLWNLWEPNNPHAVTWKVDSLELVSVRKDKDVPLPYASEAPIQFDALSLAVAPGQHVTTREQSITWSQRGPFFVSSHSAVLVHAHLGDSKQTPMNFVVPIANAMVWVKQTSAVNQTAAYANATPNCYHSNCNYGTENGLFRNPEHHLVTGRIELAASQVDVFGRPADEQVKAAQRDNARIAGVALFALSNLTNVSPVFPTKSTLSLSNAARLVSTSPGVFVRREDAEDRADEAVDFTVDLSSSDFLTTGAGPQSDAVRASGSIYLAVWTTAGSVQLQRLVVWPWLNTATAQTLVAAQSCSLFKLWQLDDSRLDCSEKAADSQGACSNYTYHQQQAQAVYGDLGLSRNIGIITSAADFFWSQGWSNDLRLTSLLGHSISVGDDDARSSLVPLCNDASFYNFPNADIDAVCSSALTGVVYYYARNLQGPGRCGGATAPPNMPLTADYRRIFRPFEVQVLKDNFGIEAPAEWTFTIN